CLVSLAVSGGAGGDDDLTGRVNAHLGAFKRAHTGALHVTTDADTKIAPALAGPLLLFSELFIIRRIQCTAQGLRKISAVVAYRHAVAIQNSGLIRHRIRLDEIASAHLGRVQT